MSGMYLFWMLRHTHVTKIGLKWVNLSPKLTSRSYTLENARNTGPKNINITKSHERRACKLTTPFWISRKIRPLIEHRHTQRTTERETERRTTSRSCAAPVMSTSRDILASKLYVISCGPHHYGKCIAVVHACQRKCIHRRQRRRHLANTDCTGRRPDGLLTH